MGIFHSKKEKRNFWVYLIISLILFIISAVYQDLKYRSISGSPSGSEYFKGSGFAILAIIIPFSYIILFSFLTMRYRKHLAHKERYQSFHDLEKEKQDKILGKVFCKQCKAYHQTSFSHEKMIDGMRWVYCRCSECGEENKVRLS